MKNLKIGILVNRTIRNMAEKRGICIDEDENTMMLYVDGREGYGDDYIDDPYLVFRRNQESGELFFHCFGDAFGDKKIEDMCHWLNSSAMLKTIIKEMDKIL